MAEKPNRVSSFQGGVATSKKSNGNSRTVSDQTKLVEEIDDFPERKLKELPSGSFIMECSVCLQPCIYPVQLECRHIFCFLCVKGAANRSKRCALCRSEISPQFFENPKLLRYEDLEKTVMFDNQYQWFYQGGNGWWQYDDRTSQEIEAKHKTGDKVFELLIAGFLYIIDLENMVQVRRNDRSRKRKIRRDLVSLEGVKGVAGLKFPKSPNKLNENSAKSSNTSTVHTPLPSDSSSTERPVGDGNELSSQAGQQIRPPNPQPSLSNIDISFINVTSSLGPVPDNTLQEDPSLVESQDTPSDSQLDLSLAMQHINLQDNMPSDFVDTSEENTTHNEHSDQTQQTEYESDTYPMTRSRSRYMEETSRHLVPQIATQGTMNDGLEDEDNTLNSSQDESDYEGEHV